METELLFEFLVLNSRVVLHYRHAAHIQIGTENRDPDMGMQMSTIELPIQWLISSLGNLQYGFKIVN